LKTAPPVFLPILGRYVVGEFVRILALCVASFVALYLVVDFFDRFDDFLKYEAKAGAVVRYFLFKIPLILTQVTPVAVLASMLLALGGLSRHNEITAMQACGVSLVQLTGPLLGTCAAISLLSLVWSEAVVPHFNRRVRAINTVEIKNRELPSLFGTSELWSHGENGLYNVRVFDARQQTLVGLTIYGLSPEFRLREVTEIPWARWNGDAWAFEKGVRRELQPGGPDGSSPRRHDRHPRNAGGPRRVEARSRGVRLLRAPLADRKPSPKRARSDGVRSRPPGEARRPVHQPGHGVPRDSVRHPKPPQHEPREQHRHRPRDRLHLLGRARARDLARPRRRASAAGRGMGRKRDLLRDRRLLAARKELNATGQGTAARKSSPDRSSKPCITFRH
jgi:hypothetical protein